VVGALILANCGGHHHHNQQFFTVSGTVVAPNGQLAWFRHQPTWRDRLHSVFEETAYAQAATTNALSPVVGATVAIIDSKGIVLGSTTTDTNGNWSLTTDPPPAP